MKKPILFGGVSAMLLASAALYAAPGAGKMKIDADGNGTVSKSEAMAGADARFAKMDANNDGTLNQADRAAKVKERFATMDADKNGAVSEPEFVAAHEERMAKREDRREMRGERKGPGHKGHRMGGRGKGGGKHFNFAESREETVWPSLRHSCGSELTRQGISLP